MRTDGEQIGAKGDSAWLYVVPWGFYKMLHWVANRYDNPGIYVTENGKWHTVNDDGRIWYIVGLLSYSYMMLKPEMPTRLRCSQ